MPRATEQAHLLIRRHVKPGDMVVDATVGNGHDTLLLASLAGPSGRVIGFDVQQAALEETAKRVAGLPQVTLVHAGHETLKAHLRNEGIETIAAAMFNLGYLPGAPRDIMTCAETTLSALEQALELLPPGGLVTLVLYPGHRGGDEEADAVRAFSQSLPPRFAVTRHGPQKTKAPAPELIAIERTG